MALPRAAAKDEVLTGRRIGRKAVAAAEVAHSILVI